LSIGLKGNNDGSGAVQIGGSDAITISTGLSTTFAGTATVPTGTLYPIVSGTAVASTSGTAIDFTGIPSWVKRITVMFNGVSTTGTSNFQIQIGSGSVDTTSTYSGSLSFLAGTVVSTAYTTGFLVVSPLAASLMSGASSLTLVSGNIWAFSSTVARSDGATGVAGGSKSLSGTLDRVRITTVNGTDTFDAGSINILYE
jgi:hypothetical protein